MEMELDFQLLIKKVLDFWKKHDSEIFSAEDLRKTFTHYELATILYNDTFEDYYFNIVRSFQKKIDESDNLFTQKEAEELVKIVLYPERFFKYLKLNDEILLSFINDNSFNTSLTAAIYLSSDEARIKGFNMVKDPYLKAYFVSNFNSDELKLQYLKKVSRDNKSKVISSLKDKELMEKYITFFNPNKVSIITNLSSDEKKIYYLKRFFNILTTAEKADIISSLKSEKHILSTLSLCDDKVKVEIISRLHVRNDDLIEGIIKMIKSEKKLAHLLSDGGIEYRFIIKYIAQITNINDLFIIVSCLNAEDKIKYLYKFNDKKKIELISDIYDGDLKFKSFSYINNKEFLFELIDHCDSFPSYSNEFEYIIDLYCDKYNLNKEHLLFVARNISLSVLKVIQNPNIIKILNASHENFMKTMQFFDKNQLKMEHSSMNDILNTFLQREFKVKLPEFNDLYPNMVHAIETKNENFLLEKLTEISQSFDINSEIVNCNCYTLTQFLYLLLGKSESAIDCLHTISAKFIIDKKNKYIQDNFKNAFEKCTINRYDKNDLLKYMINNYPTELFLSFFPHVTDDEEYFTLEEQAFLKNRDLIKQIILYKKNPNNFEQIPEVVKSNIKLFNVILEKTIASCPISSFPDININRKICEFKDVDSEFLIDIMMYLDMDKLVKSLFNNPELEKKLMKFWNQYKMGGWGKTFEPLLSGAGIFLNAEAVANFIQYFGASYEEIQEKIEKGELANMSLTALIDLAVTYSSESKKYAMVFGNENFKFLASNPGPNSSAMLKEKRIKKEIQFLKTIRFRKHVTVPPVDKDFVLKNGKKINIVVGNFSNVINLTYGERTGSCMRVGGAGKSLFNFCLEDKNGFHIRFSNPETGNFISRVSGFRNGNTVFLNELRYSTDSNYTNKDVVEACKLIADELINLSKTSSFPIENVVITPFYSMKESGMQPKNLGISDPQLGMKRFYTDVSSTSIVLSTSSENNELVTPKLGVKDIPKYPVQRDKQRIIYNVDCQEYVAHLKSLDQVLSGRDVDDIDIVIDKKLVVCFAGEDWCVTIDNNGNLTEYIMNNTNNKQLAMDELKAALMYMKENLNKEIAIAKISR